jgi:hypothetical protein
MTTKTLDNSECECKYCAGKKLQTDVNESVFGTPSSRSTPRLSTSKRPIIRPKRSAGESSKTPPPHNPRRRQEPKTKIPENRPPVSKSNLPPKRDRTERLRYIELHEGRTIRISELVWIPLSKPIRSSQKSLSIEFWPAMVEDVDYNKQAVQDPDGMSYSVMEKRYLVTRPLSSGLTVAKVLDSTALPYRAWDLDTRLIDLVKTFPFPKELEIMDSMVFDPRDCYGELISGLTLEQAAPYFALAVQTAARMDTYWSPQHEMVFPSSRSSAIYYQGLWLGAERIWLNELVRLVPDHRDLLSHEILSNRLSEPLESSESRSMFMRVNEITVDDAMTIDGPRKVCRVSGPVFCSIPDPQYKYGESSSDVLSPPETNTIPAITDGVDFPMPVPPLGFQYKLVTPLDQELTLDCLMIAGRVYPKLLLNPALDIPSIRENQDKWWLGLLSMSGLAPGHYSKSNARYFRHDRKKAAETSEAEAIGDIKSAWIRPNAGSKQGTRNRA